MKYTRQRRIAGTQTCDLLKWTFGVYSLDFILIYISFFVFGYKLVFYGQD